MKTHIEDAIQHIGNASQEIQRAMTSIDNACGDDDSEYALNDGRADMVQALLVRWSEGLKGM